MALKLERRTQDLKAWIRINSMNHLAATYIDFVQTIGVILIFAVAAYAVKEMLLRVEKVQIKVED